MLGLKVIVCFDDDMLVTGPGEMTGGLAGPFWIYITRPYFVGSVRHRPYTRRRHEDSLYWRELNTLLSMSPSRH